MLYPIKQPYVGLEQLLCVRMEPCGAVATGLLEAELFYFFHALGCPLREFVGLQPSTVHIFAVKQHNH